MNKGSGVGVGSASIVLVFAVLCLAVFSLITFVVAGNGKVLVDAEAKLVTEYYEADVLAERIVAEIINSAFIPDSVHGIDIEQTWVWEMDSYVMRFFCPLADSSKSLYVKMAMGWDSYEILTWRMWDEGEWAPDEGMNVWLGPEDGNAPWLMPGDNPIAWLGPDD